MAAHRCPSHHPRRRRCGTRLVGDNAVTRVEAVALSFFAVAIVILAVNLAVVANG